MCARKTRKLLHRSNRGFTLVELLLVAALIALLAATVTPLFSGMFRSIGLEDATARLAQEIRTARLEAMHRQLKVLWSVDEDAREYVFRLQEVGAGRTVKYTNFGDAFWDKRREFPSGVSLDKIEQGGQVFRPPQLVFEPSGLMKATIVWVADRDGRMGKISIGPWVDDVRGTVTGSGADAEKRSDE